MKNLNFSLFAILTGVLVIPYIFIFTACNNSQVHDDGINALFLMPRNYGLNYFLYRDNFENFGYNITYTGVLDTVRACPPCDIYFNVPPVISELLVTEIHDLSKYDCLVVPTASGEFNPVDNSYTDIIESAEAIALLQSAADFNLPVSATCAGVRVLAASDLIAGKQVVGGKRFQDEYEAAGAVYLGKDHHAVNEDNIITGARGLYYNFQNCNAVALAVESKGKRGEKHGPNDNLIFSMEVDFADSSVSWSKTIGGKFAEGVKTICESHDNGLILVGYTFSAGTGDADILMCETDRDGKIRWARIFGGAGFDYGFDCIQVEDGYLVTGYTTSYGAGSRDLFLVKTDLDGRQLWAKAFGGESWDVGMSVAETRGGYLVAGYTHSFGAGEEDIYLVKTDKTGEKKWSKTYGGKRSEIANTVTSLADGNILIAATTGTFPENTDNKNNDFYLVKADAEGELIWSEQYDNSGDVGYGYDWCNSMGLASNGDIILIGSSDRDHTMDATVMRLDPGGNSIWTKTYGNSAFYDYGASFFEDADGKIFLCGTAKSYPNNNDFYLVRIDSEGNETAHKVIGGNESEWSSALIAAGENGIILAGHTLSEGMGSSDICIVKIEF